MIKTNSIRNNEISNEKFKMADDKLTLTRTTFSRANSKKRTENELNILTYKSKRYVHFIKECSREQASIDAWRSDTENLNRNMWGISTLFLREPIWPEVRQRDIDPRHVKQTHCQNYVKWTIFTQWRDNWKNLREILCKYNIKYVRSIKELLDLRMIMCSNRNNLINLDCWLWTGWKLYLRKNNLLILLLLLLSLLFIIISTPVENS